MTVGKRNGVYFGLVSVVAGTSSGCFSGYFRPG